MCYVLAIIASVAKDNVPLTMSETENIGILFIYLLLSRIPIYVQWSNTHEHS